MSDYFAEAIKAKYDVDDRTGEQLKGKALDDAYKSYLQKERSYYSPTMHK